MTKQSYLRQVTYQHTIAYEIVNCANLLDPYNPSLLSVGKIENAHRFVVVDRNVAKYHGSAIRDYFHHNKVDARIIPFDSGEEYKTIESYQAIVRELDSFPICRRDEPVIAIGGGVLTDVVGFVASTYRRGVPHIKVPTTLMGYVDASIGVKAGINFDGYKNRLGGFAPPVKVLLDRSLLKTLPHRHILNGVCEILKLALIKDAELFSLLESHGFQSVVAKFQDEPGSRILDRSISGMLEELEPNLLEEELARRADFGHTFSYGLEMQQGSNLFHGEAVLLDIIISTLIAGERNLLSVDEVERVFQLVFSLGLLPEFAILDAGLLWHSLEERVYHRNGLQRTPLPQGIGSCTFVNDVTLGEIEIAVEQVHNRVTMKNGVI
jgi:3-dehydroquinate synthetase